MDAPGGANNRLDLMTELTFQTGCAAEEAMLHWVNNRTVFFRLSSQILQSFFHFLHALCCSRLNDGEIVMRRYVRRIVINDIFRNLAG